MKNLKVLLNGDELLAVSGNLDVMITGITNDSRRVEKGNCFVAIKGFKEDGAKYIAQAVAAGAAAIVTESNPDSHFPGIAWIQVKNDRHAFSKLSARFYDHIAGRYYNVGVTGTNGKTTVTSLIAAIFNKQSPTVQIGTLGMSCCDTRAKTTLTTPEPHDMFQFLTDAYAGGARNLVMEVSSASLCLYRVEDIKFTMAIFTTFSGDHLDFHKTMEDYFEAKMALFKKLHHNDWAILNIDDPYAYKILDEVNCNYLTCGFSEDADVKPLKFKLTTSGIKAILLTPKGELNIKSPLIGRVNLTNILIAVAAAIVKGIPLNEIATALEEFKPVKGRLDFAWRKDFSVLIDYAHTDNAMEALLKSLRELTNGRLITVFGAGGNRDQTKRPRMGKVASEFSDFVVVTSDNPRGEDPDAIIKAVISGFKPGFSHYLIEPDREKAIAAAINMAQKGDIIAIAGKGHEDYQIFKDRTIHFDDYEVVQKIMTQKEQHA